MADSTSFDPFTQSFTLLLTDGTPFNVSMPELDDFVLYNVQICINFAAQLGASLILLIVLLLIAKPDKRRAPIFIINALSLVLNVIRNVLQCVYFTGPFSEIYAYFGQDYSRVPKSAYATSITAPVLTFLLLVCAEISLILQVRVVCVTLREIYRRAIFVLSVNIALLAIGFRLALCIENSKDIISLAPETALQWLTSAANIMLSISVCWFCAVFVTKLGFALVQRRKLGLAQFGPMQIIFIMGCQTLILPAIFSIIQYFSGLPAMDSNVLTLVAIFLPLSSLWASASTRPQSPNKVTDMRRKFFGSYTSGSTGPIAGGKEPLSPANTATTRVSGSLPPSPASAGQQAMMHRDLEAQGLAGIDHYLDGIGVKS